MAKPDVISHLIHDTLPVFPEQSKSQCDGMGSLNFALFEQEMYLPNGVSLKIRFHRHRGPFIMITGDGNMLILKN